MSDAIVEMSTKGLGCVGIIDAEAGLAGSVTDGDLRRHMSAGLLLRPVDTVMTHNPRTVRPGQLASKALEISNRSKFTALPVVDASEPVRLVYFHDLPRTGVAE